MSKKLSKAMVVGVIGVLVMSLGAVAAFAQEDTTPDNDARPAIPFGPGGFGGSRGHHGGGDNDEALAESLGITVEELQAAREQVAADRLAQAVEDGTVTQEQVDSMQAMQAVREYIDHEAIMAQVFGVTAEELEAARENGTMRDLLSAGEFDPTAIQEQMQAATEAAVAEALAAGDITAEQAQLITEQLAEGAGMMGKFGGKGGFPGGKDGFRGGKGGFPGFGGAPQVDEDGNTVSPFSNFRNAPGIGA